MPLIGEQGWAEDGRRAASNHLPGRTRSLPQMIADAAEPLPDLDDPAFGALFERYADRRVVLLGEASHGTSEFYRARAAISRHLIERHGFEILAVEADWPDAAAVDRYVRHKPGRLDAELPFQRFPTWMWRNVEMDELLDWMRSHNDGVPAGKRTGFYGLDIYNMHGSIAAVLAYLDRVDPRAASVRERYGASRPGSAIRRPMARRAVAPLRQCEEAVVAHAATRCAGVSTTPRMTATASSTRRRTRG